MFRWEIINKVIKDNNLKSYLEIGLDNGANFRNIECENKESCDPYLPNEFSGLEGSAPVDEDNNLLDDILSILTYRMTSDEMFKENKKKYDLIFIDGLHERHQVLRDIKNSLSHLNNGGFIVIHDCLPPRKECQIVPRIESEWNGDVWKVLPYLKSIGLNFEVIDNDYGVGVIKYQKIDIPIKEFDYKYEDYFYDIEIRNKELNVISVETFLEEIKNGED